MNYFGTNCIAGRKEFVMFEHEDFSVVVKMRSNAPMRWRWEIYRAGCSSPIDRSVEFFATVGEATRAGKKALQLFLSKYLLLKPPHSSR